MRASRLTVWAVSIAVTLLAYLTTASEAHAYAWMIRHGYTSCTPCHTDPSGAGPLAAYGRAQGDLLLRTHYGAPPEEASPTAGFLFGAVPLPDTVRLQGDVRGAVLTSKQATGRLDQRYILMRADLFGDIKLWRVRAAGSIGYAHAGALDAALTHETRDNLITREHWLGFELDEDGAWLVRAGRIALPFGIRSVEHTLWTRVLTRTDMLDDQQHGVALSVSKDNVRAEIMGIAGNLQLHPDEYRERGVSGFVEFAPSTRLAVGASTLFTRATRDLDLRVSNYRQAHGLFARYSPTDPLVLMAEGDWVYQSLQWNGHRSGFAAMVQADWEVTQGLHLMLTGESKNDGNVDQPNSYGGWLSAVWFFGRHVDVRIDNVYQRIGNASGNTDALALLLQLHLYL